MRCWRWLRTHPVLEDDARPAAAAAPRPAAPGHRRSSTWVPAAAPSRSASRGEAGLAVLGLDLSAGGARRRGRAQPGDPGSGGIWSNLASADLLGAGRTGSFRRGGEQPARTSRRPERRRWPPTCASSSRGRRARRRTDGLDVVPQAACRRRGGPPAREGRSSWRSATARPRPVWRWRARPASV